MKTVELTEEELQVFKTIYIDNALYEYLSYSESGKLYVDWYSSLFIKLGINLNKGEGNASS